MLLGLRKNIRIANTLCGTGLVCSFSLAPELAETSDSQQILIYSLSLISSDLSVLILCNLLSFGLFLG